MILLFFSILLVVNTILIRLTTYRATNARGLSTCHLHTQLDPFASEQANWVHNLTVLFVCLSVCLSVC